MTDKFCEVCRTYHSELITCVPILQPKKVALCEICEEQMPAGEEMFRYHGNSGPCPRDAEKSWNSK